MSASTATKAGQLIIEFREGDEQPWVERMIDSRKAMKAFNSCLEKISPTQPVAPVTRARAVLLPVDKIAHALAGES